TERAGHLPNSSVEQIFTSDDPDATAETSRLFTVRTSEKERVLVLTAVDRLVSEDGKPVLQKATAELATDLSQAPPGWRRKVGLKFSSPDPAFKGASTDYVRS